MDLYFFIPEGPSPNLYPFPCAFMRPLCCARRRKNVDTRPHEAREISKRRKGNTYAVRGQKLY